MAEPATVDPPDRVFRVGRSGSPIHFSRISPGDAQLPQGGNRYDVAGGGVLYAASQRVACYGETLSRLRPTPSSFDLDEEDPKYMRVGDVPRDWRTRRVMATLRVVDGLPFVNVDAPETQAFLSVSMAPLLAALGYEDNIDLSVLRSPDRRLSRAIALWAYSEMDDEGAYLYSGIRYASRIDDSWENWAVFDGTDVSVESQQGIELSDPDLQRVARMWSLTVR